MYQRIIINCDEDWRFTSGVRNAISSISGTRLETTLKIKNIISKSGAIGPSNSEDPLA